jgi:predicted site-specific integrase-resolvase
MQTRPSPHLNQIELANRWKISPRTLERWRWAGQGPAFVKLGGRVVYSLEAIEAYERGRVCQSTQQGTALRKAS